MKTFAFLTFALLLAVPVLKATSYAAAKDAYAAALAPQDRLAAASDALAAPDLPEARKGYWLKQRADALRGTGALPVVYLPAYQAAYEAGDWGAFSVMLTMSISIGGDTRMQALAKVPEFLARAQANPGNDPSVISEVQAGVAFDAKQYDAAFNLFKVRADSRTAYDSVQGWSAWSMVQCAMKRGDTPAAINAIIIPYMTASNVHVADGAYTRLYDLVNRSPAVMSADATREFLGGILGCVDVTRANADFLGKVSSQLAALPTPVPVQ